MSISFSTYRGSKVFHLHPYYKDLGGSFNRVSDRVGTPFGYQSIQTVQDYAEFVSSSFVYRATGLEDISAISDLFDEIRGRWKGLWFPSWMSDFKLSADIGASDVVLNVKKSDDFGTMYPVQNKTGWHIFIYVSQSEWYARRITGYGTNNTITINESLGKAHVKERVKFVSFLYKGRFNFDTLEFTFVTPTVVEFPMVFAETPYEYTTTSTTTTTTTTTA